MLLAILCSAIVLVSLFGEARSDHSVHESPVVSEDVVDFVAALAV